MRAMKAVSALPRIIRFFDSTRSDGATCPHCGAPGAVVHHFEVEDGRRLGAMSGCVQLFPVAPIAREDLALRKKEQDYAKRQWKMPSWDTARREAIERFYAGELTEQVALALVRQAKANAAAYRQRRGWR